jgi:hypothetical protein
MVLLKGKNGQLTGVLGRTTVEDGQFKLKDRLIIKIKEQQWFIQIFNQ